MDLLGDFGGFNDAIVFIVSTLFASYGARMYEDSIAKRLKITPKKKFRANHDAQIEAFRTKISDSQNDMLSLNQKDLQTLHSIIKTSTEKLKIPFIKALCYMKLCCRKDRHIKAREKTIERFEKCLDIS